MPKEISANYCIEIEKKDNELWRICTDSRPDLLKLHTKVNFNIIKLNLSKGKKLEKKLMEKFMINNSAKQKDESNEEMKNWHWDKQKSWKNYCKNHIYQSPINLLAENVSSGKKSNTKFEIDYHFEEVHTLVKKHENELVVHFLNNAGLLRFTVDNTYLVYQPQYMSFRFPGEHLYNGKRYPGEVQVFFTELNPNKKSWVTNGLVLSIPLSPGKDNQNLKFFEDLNPDFWKLEVKRKGEYIPKKTLKKKKLVFSLEDMFKKVDSLKPDYLTYVGSESIPPCSPNVIYVLSNKPFELANCQFKVLRENSLMTDRPKEIHSRLPQESNNRKIYEIGMKDNSNIRNVLEMIKKENKIYTKALGKEDKDCKSKSKGKAIAVIKKPLIPKNLKELKEKIKKDNKKTMKALSKDGPEKQKALEKLKGENLNCNKI